jgi:RHS repeat-associated protein
VVGTSTGGGVAGATYRYDPYGQDTTRVESTSTASELGYTGQLRLSNGLYVTGIRVYDARMRQFLQPDVLTPMSYTYAAGDPINRIDPSGMLDEPPRYNNAPEETIIVTGSRIRRELYEWEVFMWESHRLSSAHDLARATARNRSGGERPGRRITDREINAARRSWRNVLPGPLQLTIQDDSKIRVLTVPGLKSWTQDVCQSGCDSMLRTTTHTPSTWMLE